MFNGGVGDRGIVLQLATFEAIKKAHKKVLKMVRSSLDGGEEGDAATAATIKKRSDFSSADEYGNYVKTALKQQISASTGSSSPAAVKVRSTPYLHPLNALRFTLQ